MRATWNGVYMICLMSSFHELYVPFLVLIDVLIEYCQSDKFLVQNLQHC